MRNIFDQELDVGGTSNITRMLTDVWRQKRATVVVPVLYIALYLCVVMSIMLFIERLYMACVILAIKLLGKQRYNRYKMANLTEDVDEGKTIPKVLVQIPMYNEREVYKLSIGAACLLSWPTHQLIVQVLDDSTNASIREMVQAECKKWCDKGVNVKYENRDNRSGYKAGALREGLQKDYVADCDYVAIFDADFQPAPDFLSKTVPYLLENPELGLVQAKWKFGKTCESIRFKSSI